MSRGRWKEAIKIPINSVTIELKEVVSDYVMSCRECDGEDRHTATLHMNNTYF